MLIAAEQKTIPYFTKIYCKYFTNPKGYTAKYFITLREFF